MELSAQLRPANDDRIRRCESDKALHRDYRESAASLPMTRRDAPGATSIREVNVSFWSPDSQRLGNLILTF